MRHLIRGIRRIPPRLASWVGETRLGIPPTVTQAMRGMADSEWVRVAAPEVTDGELVISIFTEHQRDRLHFSVPDGFRTHSDLVAAAATPLLGGRHRRISFDFPVSEQVREQIESRTGADVTTSGTGDPRPPGSRVALNFSGGMDSLAAWLLAPDDVTRIAIDFGGWFHREREFFETLDPEVVCTTDFRSKGYATGDWLFMGVVAMLFADHLDLGWIGFGTNFESAPHHYRARGWVPKMKNSSPLPRLVSAVGLRGCVLTRGMTEFCGSLVVDRFAPHLADDSLRSAARLGSEKSFRKRLAYDSAVAFRGGPPVDLEDRSLPRRKIKMWTSYPVDFAMLAVMAMYPPEFVHRFMGELEPGLLDAAREIRPEFVFRYNPMFVDQIPVDRRATVLRRMADAGVEMYHDDDWPEYEKLRRILARHHVLPD